MSQYDYESRLIELTNGIDDTFKNILEQFIYDTISEYIINKSRKIDILDVGCGCGYLTASIAKKFAGEVQVEGIDIDDSAIDCAKSHFNLRFCKQDVVGLDEKKKKYDVVVYNMVLHNLMELEPAIAKTKLVLKNKGIVIITIPHPAYWLADKISRGKIALEGPFNYNVEMFYKIPFQIKNGSQHRTELTYYHRMLSTYMNTFSKYLDILKFQEVDLKNGYPTMLRFVLKKSDCK